MRTAKTGTPMLTSTAMPFASTQSGFHENMETQVRRASGEEVHAFLNKDDTALRQLWSDDLIVTNPLNRLATKTQVLDMIKAGFLLINSYDRTIEYLRIVGDLAIVAGSENVTWGGTMPMAGKSEHLRFTAVWMMQDGQWREVARHANIVSAQQLCTGPPSQFNPDKMLRR